MLNQKICARLCAPADVVWSGWLWMLIVGFMGLSLLFSGSVFAGDAGGSIEVFQRPLDAVTALFTGPIAAAFSLLGIIVCGLMLVFGGEIGDFTKKFLILVLVICLIVGANQIITGFFTGGATLNVPPVSGVESGSWVQGWMWGVPGLGLLF